jgi:hypothetical protein
MQRIGSAGEGGDFELGAGAGIGPVAPGIAQKIEGEHGDHDGERGKDDHVRCAVERARREKWRSKGSLPGDALDSRH